MGRRRRVSCGDRRLATGVPAVVLHADFICCVPCSKGLERRGDPMFPGFRHGSSRERFRSPDSRNDSASLRRRSKRGQNLLRGAMPSGQDPSMASIAFSRTRFWQGFSQSLLRPKFVAPRTRTSPRKLDERDAVASRVFASMMPAAVGEIPLCVRAQSRSRSLAFKLQKGRPLAAVRARRSASWHVVWRCRAEIEKSFYGASLRVFYA